MTTAKELSTAYPTRTAISCWHWIWYASGGSSPHSSSFHALAVLICTPPGPRGSWSSSPSKDASMKGCSADRAIVKGGTRVTARPVTAS